MEYLYILKKFTVFTTFLDDKFKEGGVEIDNTLFYYNWISCYKCWTSSFSTLFKVQNVNRVE